MGASLHSLRDRCLRLRDVIATSEGPEMLLDAFEGVRKRDPGAFAFMSRHSEASRSVWITLWHRIGRAAEGSRRSTPSPVWFLCVKHLRKLCGPHWCPNLQDPTSSPLGFAAWFGQVEVLRAWKYHWKSFFQSRTQLVASVGGTAAIVAQGCVGRRIPVARQACLWKACHDLAGGRRRRKDRQAFQAWMMAHVSQASPREVPQGLGARRVAKAGHAASV